MVDAVRAGDELEYVLEDERRALNIEWGGRSDVEWGEGRMSKNRCRF